MITSKGLPLFLLLLAGSASAQDPQRIDSLLADLGTRGEDTLRLRTLAALSIEYNDERANATDEQLIALATELGAARDTAVQHAGWRYEGDARIRRSNRRSGYMATKEGLPELRRALELFTRLKDARRQAWALTSIAAVHYNQGDQVGWLQITQQVNALLLSVGDSSTFSRNWSMLSAFHRERGNLDAALAQARTGLAVERKRGRPVTIIMALDQMAEIMLQQDRVDSAVIMNDEAMRLAKETGKQALVAGCIAFKGRLAERDGDWRMALRYYHMSDSIQPDTTRAVIAARSGRDGRLWYQMGDHARALRHGLIALEGARASGSPSSVEPAAALLRDVYRALHRPKEALEMWELQVQMRDSLYSTAAADQLDRFEFRQEQLADSLVNEQAKAQAAFDHQQELRKETNQRNLLLFAALGALFGVGGVLLGLRSARKRRALLRKERARSEALLLNILPAEVADELKRKGEVDARQLDEVTVLFTDFKGFTAMSERLSPKQLVRDIHECFSAFDRIMEKCGVEKIKTIGDAYMAAGGLPVPNATHAYDVVKAALEIREFIAEGKRLKIEKGLPYFEIRIGIHTGPVVAGIVGVKKFAYDIWGDTVNIASGMESAGEAGQVNISASTYAAVKNAPDFVFTPRGKVEAKGRSGSEMYFVNPRVT